MARLINLSTPEGGVNCGMELSFYAPCDSDEVNGISLAGETYDLVDANGNSLCGCSNSFESNAMITVIIDTVGKKAHLLNPCVNSYTKSLGTPNDTASAEGTTVWARVKQSESEIETLKTSLSNIKDENGKITADRLKSGYAQSTSNSGQFTIQSKSSGVIVITFTPNVEGNNVPQETVVVYCDSIGVAGACSSTSVSGYYFKATPTGYGSCHLTMFDNHGNPCATKDKTIKYREL